MCFTPNGNEFMSFNDCEVCMNLYGMRVLSRIGILLRNFDWCNWMFLRNKLTHLYPPINYFYNTVFTEYRTTHPQESRSGADLRAIKDYVFASGSDLNLVI